MSQFRPSQPLNREEYIQPPQSAEPSQPLPQYMQPEQYQQPPYATYSPQPSQYHDGFTQHSIPAMPEHLPQYAQPQQHQPMPPQKPYRNTPAKQAVMVIATFVCVFGALFAVAYGLKANSGASTLTSDQLTATAQSSLSDQQTMTTYEQTNTAGDATAIAQETAYASSPIATAPPYTPVPTTPPNPQGDIGVTQQSGIWAVTVNSVKASQGDTYDTPKAGDYYIIINTTAVNTDTQTHTLNGIFFTLIDNQGNNYDETFIANQQKNYGDVVGGQKLRGDTVFEVPTSLKSFTLQFEDVITQSQIMQWNLSV